MPPLRCRCPVNFGLCRIAASLAEAACLGFDHDTFFANGRVAWVEEIMVDEDVRGRGVGKALMQAFEAWARGRDLKLVALATRRAGQFYLALGYEDSATYFRKML